MDFIEGDSWLSALVSFTMMVGLAFVPAVPIPVIAGIIGANFPLSIALLITVGGTVVGCVGMFSLCRNVMQRYARKQLLRYRYLTSFLALLDRNPFLAVLIARLVPIMPSAAVNAIAGITTMRMGVFFSATIIGKLPSMLTFTYAGSQLENAWFQSLLLIGLYVLVIGLIARKLLKRSDVT